MLDTRSRSTDCACASVTRSSAWTSLWPARAICWRPLRSRSSWRAESVWKRTRIRPVSRSQTVTTAPRRRRPSEDRGSMRGTLTALLLAATLVACAGNDRHTLAELHEVEPDMTEVQVQDGLDQAMVGYRKFLEEAPESALTPEAMRRLADLKLEKEYGILGDWEIVELPAPEPTAVTADAGTESHGRSRAAGIADHSESEAEFERRAD